MRYALLAASAVVLLAGCSSSRDIGDAERAIHAFHNQLDDGEFDAIYNASGPIFKKASSAEDSMRFLSALHQKMGVFQSGKTVGWTDNVATNGHFLRLNYAATYSGGPAEETFLYDVSKSAPVLEGYHVNLPWPSTSSEPSHAAPAATTRAL